MGTNFAALRVKTQRFSAVKLFLPLSYAKKAQRTEKYVKDRCVT